MEIDTEKTREEISDILREPYHKRIKQETKFRSLVYNLNTSESDRISIRHAFHTPTYINDTPQHVRLIIESPNLFV